MTQAINQPSPEQPTTSRSFIKRLLTNRRLWAVLIVLVGLWLMFFFGTRTLRAYREFEYAREQGLLNGTASVDAIQPWMTIRYVAVAYAVPEEYIYAKLAIPFNRRSERDPLGRLSHQRQPGPPLAESRTTPEPPPDPQHERDALLAQVGDIILAYRENPVAPGLRDIRPWMSLAYIANSTGVPVDYLVETLANMAIELQATEFAGKNEVPPGLRAVLDTEENRYKPLELLSDDLHYPGGPGQMIDAVRDALATFEETAPQQETPAQE